MTRFGKVLRVPPFSQQFHDMIGAAYDALDLPEDDRPAFLEQHRAEIVAIVCSNWGRVDADLIAALPRLGIIANQGVGYDNIDVAAAIERDVAVSHTPGVLDAAVAETALGLLIATRRRMVEADRFVRAGRWSEETFPLTPQVSGSRVGVLGLGRVGRKIASMLDALDCEVAYHSRHEVSGARYRYHPSATDLAAAVDNLVVIVPGGPATAGLVDRSVLDALGPDGVLVNVARGSVVDEDALLAALAEGRLGAAGLDVFAQEPVVPEALRALDNVVLLPHVGSGTEETRAAMRALTLANLDAWLAGEPLPTPVPEMGVSS